MEVEFIEWKSTIIEVFNIRMNSLHKHVYTDIEWVSICKSPIASVGISSAL